MVRALQATAVVCGIFGVLFLITALATSKWMEGCVLMDNFLDIISTAMSGLSASALQIFKGKSMCYSTGLFRLSWSVASLISYNIAIPINSVDRFVQASAVSFVVGLILLLPAIILTALSACSASVSAQRKRSASNYSKIGFVLFLLGAICIFAGTLTYTIPQSKTLHNPIRFIQEIGSGMQNAMTQIMSDENVPAPNNGVSAFQPEQREQLLALFKGMDPMYGYSFYLAWISCVLCIVATVTGALSCRGMRRGYSGDDFLVPMLQENQLLE